ncbi:MAG: hypothetical protein IKZ98_12620 [Clostridia bacterium]|nr:hypothetical protein [Clostridia bacterium]
MKDKELEMRIQHSLNAELSGLNTTSWQRDKYFENATGGYKVKRKLTYGLVLAIVLLLAAATAIAVALLSPREVVEQIAVPMAQENDSDWRVNTEFSPEELAEFIRAANEIGITIDENDDIMQALKNGKGYDEEEAIMEVCRQAFGGTYSFWTLEQKHWFDEMMVAIGFADGPMWSMPGEGELSEEEAKAKLIAAIQDEFGDEMYQADYDEEMDLADKDKFKLALDYYPEPAKDGTVWHMDAWPRSEERLDYYTAALDKDGNVLNAIARTRRNPNATEHPAQKPVREAADPAQAAVQESETEKKGWISLSQLDSITADNILERAEDVYGLTNDWTSEIWASVAEAVREMPAETMEGKMVKATPWIAWREGLLTLEQAEEQAYRRTGLRMGDTNTACLIDSQPNPVWKFYLINYSGDCRDMVVEIDAVTGEITDLDMFMCQNPVESYYRIYTLHRTWAKMELEAKGPLHLAQLAVLHTFADLSFDLPQDDSIPIFDETFWQPEIDGNTVTFRCHWSNLPDYRVTLDENGLPTEVVELPSSGTEELPAEKMPGADAIF